MAYAIPDFEGQAILRIFANSTESEIGCYSAVVTNGNSFSHPSSVGTVLGIFALVTVVASFATAIYGEAVPTMRLHYAHSLSVGVVMAVFQHIFFTGALSVNWPSVLVAWWSNFAWAGGMINSKTMQRSIDHLIGNNIGNTSQVGAAPSDQTNTVGGGYSISQIYGRGLSWPINHPLRRDLAPVIYQRDAMSRHVERTLQARDTLINKTDGYRWYGHPVGPGLPLPGNYSGFAGTLGQEGIRVSNAFMTGFLWLLILLVLLVGAVVAFKWILEGLARFKKIKDNRLKFFRDHWRRYTVALALRTCYIAFFLMMFLTIFEFTYQSSAGVKVVAAIVFLIFIIGVPGVAWYACYYKKHFITSDPNSGAHAVEHKKLLGRIPWAGKKASENNNEVNLVPQEPAPESKSGEKKSSFWKRMSSTGSTMNNPDAVVDNIHDNDDYTMKFGWLSARFRRTRWWFFTVWLFYEFLRAVFYAGASGYALAQVFGLLIIEFLAFVYIIWVRPFEGRRLNVIVVYCLGFSKVASVALSAAFDIHFNLARITTTVIGIVVVIIQGVLTIITMIAVIVGAISSYMSVSRNHEEFRPRKWHGLRERYFDHLDRVANDLPREPKPKQPKQPKRANSKKSNSAAEEVEPGFEMKGMRRLAKIEDEDEEFASEMRSQDPNASYISLNNRAASPAMASDAALAGGTATPIRTSRAPSVQSMSQSHLPFGARPHRPSWSTRDFSLVGAEDPQRSFTPIDMNRSVADDEPLASPAPPKGRHSRSASLSSMLNRDKQPAAAKAVKPTASADSLGIGGEYSTRDMIGKVPAPTMRARTGSQLSGRNSNSRIGTPVHGEDRDSGAWENQQHAGSSSQRGSRYAMLTPAQEMDEWGSPKQSQDEAAK